MEAFASKYIASLPTTDRKDVVSDLGYRMLKGNLKKVINKGADLKVWFQLCITEAVYSDKRLYRWRP
jgi:zinc protease